MLPDEGAPGGALVRVHNDGLAPEYAQVAAEVHLIPFVPPIVQRLDAREQVSYREVNPSRASRWGRPGYLGPESDTPDASDGMGSCGNLVSVTVVMTGIGHRQSKASSCRTPTPMNCSECTRPEVAEAASRMCTKCDTADAAAGCHR